MVTASDTSPPAQAQRRSDASWPPHHLPEPAFERKFEFADFRQRSISLLRKNVVKPPPDLDVGQPEADGDWLVWFGWRKLNVNSARPPFAGRESSTLTSLAALRKDSSNVGVAQVSFRIAPRCPGQNRCSRILPMSESLCPRAGLDYGRTLWLNFGTLRVSTGSWAASGHEKGRPFPTISARRNPKTHAGSELKIL
jgi:hypothetical protein